MTHGSRTRPAPALLATLLLAAGVVVWGLAVFAVGRAGEDLCLDDMVERSYGSSVQRGEVVPPRVECVLRGPDDPDDPAEVVVDHPLTAAVRFGAVVVLPVVWVVGAGVVLLRTRRRAEAPAGQP